MLHVLEKEIEKLLLVHILRRTVTLSSLLLLCVSTGPGSELSESLLNQVSITGATVTPGDDVPALKTTSSKNIDWKKPIHNGTILFLPYGTILFL